MNGSSVRICFLLTDTTITFNVFHFNFKSTIELKKISLLGVTLQKSSIIVLCVLISPSFVQSVATSRYLAHGLLRVYASGFGQVKSIVLLAHLYVVSLQVTGTPVSYTHLTLPTTPYV